MYVYQRKYRAMLFLVLISSLCCGESAPPSDVRSSVRTSSDIAQLRDRLSDLPSDSIIAELSDALANDPDFHDASLRGKAYQILIDRRSQMNPLGRRQLQECLREDRYRGLCASALAEVPPEAKREVIESLAESLEKIDHTKETSSFVPVLRALSNHGAAAQPFAENVENIFRDPLLSPELRGVAAKAMSRISGSTHALPILLADTDAEVHLWPLAALDTDMKDAYTLDEASRDMLQDFVLKIMRNPDKRIRETGFESLVPAYADDFIVGNEKVGFDVNPEFREAVEYMAAHESDEKLRRRAQGVVDTLDKRLKNAIRRRQNPDKYAPSKPPPSDKP